jgi:hypothetical protein
VVGVVAPQDQSLLGLVSRLAPAIVSGNTVIAIASERAPMPAVSLGEVLATSDVPGGVVNLLTGNAAELVPWLAGHMDVNALDVTGVPADLTAQVEELAAENVKRVHRRAGRGPVQRRRPEPVRDHRAHGVQDRVAPDGGLTEAASRPPGSPRRPPACGALDPLVIQPSGPSRHRRRGAGRIACHDSRGRSTL